MLSRLIAIVAAFALVAGAAAPSFAVKAGDGIVVEGGVVSRANVLKTV